MNFAAKLHSFASPGRFMRMARVLLPVTGTVAVLALSLGLYLALFGSPPDYRQGDAVRIMYVHVPAAYMATTIYGIIALMSAVALIWRHALAHIIARVSAPIGAGFTFTALVAGALWGQPIWTTWWVWDARLTSFLILFFVYIGYIALWNAFDDREKAARAAAILGLVGAINLPIIKFSVDWLNTLHQPASLLRGDGIAMNSAMLWPLFTMMIGFTAFYVTLLFWRVEAEILSARINVMRQNQAAGQ